MRKLSKKEQFIAAVQNWDHSAEAYNEMTNLCVSRPDEIPFYQWIKQKDWTLGAIIAFFRYHCLWMNGSIDWEEFENEFDVWKSKIYPFFE